MRAGAAVEGGCPTGGCRTHGLASLLAGFMWLLADFIWLLADFRSLLAIPAAAAAAATQRTRPPLAARGLHGGCSRTSRPDTTPHFFRRLAAGCLAAADLQSNTHPTIERRRNRHPRLSQRCPSSIILPACWATAAQPHHTSIFSPPAAGQLPLADLRSSTAQQCGQLVSLAISTSAPGRRRRRRASAEGGEGPCQDRVKSPNKTFRVFSLFTPTSPANFRLGRRSPARCFFAKRPPALVFSMFSKIGRASQNGKIAPGGPLQFARFLGDGPGKQNRDSVKWVNSAPLFAPRLLGCDTASSPKQPAEMLQLSPLRTRGPDSRERHFNEIGEQCTTFRLSPGHTNHCSYHLQCHHHY